MTSKLEELIAKLCPNGVEYKKIGDVAIKISDGMHNLPKGISSEGEYPVLSAQNINNGFISVKSSKWVSKEIFDVENKRTNVSKNDVLLTIVGAIGRVAVIESDIKALFQRSVCVIKPNIDIVFPKFLYHSLLSSNIQNYMSTNAHGAAQKGLYLKQVYDVTIPVPPLEVQAEIVRILDTFTELTAELTAELTSRKKQYEYYRDALLTFDDNNPLRSLIQRYCPNGVEYHSLEELFVIKNGYTPSKSNSEFWTDGTVPWFRMDDIRAHGRVLSDSIQHVTKSAVKSGKLFPANSIILATTATIGEHALVIVDSLANQQFTFFSKRESLSFDLDMKYVFYYFFIIDEWCKRNVNAASFASVDMPRLRKLEIPIPPLEVQRQIVQILDRFDALCNDLTQGLPAEIEARRKQYEYYRDQLLDFKRA